MRPFSPERLPARLKDQRGQASIMIGMMMMTFILFFGFVVNIGMLVNAKINLQNAADLAAYAGASAQARLLNQISFLNYEMRRQYKKFIFRYYVMGNMAQRSFPRNASAGQGKTPAFWSPDGKVDYAAPLVCMIRNSNDNPCQLPSVPHIQIPNSNPLDAINETLIQQLKKIEEIRQNGCLRLGFSNTMTLRLWLWNTDPTLDGIQAQLSNIPELQPAMAQLRGTASGLGLVPRELILRQRIATLNEYVNQAPARNLTLDKVEAMKHGADPAVHERSIEAFLSAYYTLGDHAFPTDTIVMDELQPETLLTLKDIKAQFDTFAVNFDTTPIPGGNGARDCTPFVEADTVRSKLPLGVYKDRKVLTYYAVRLKAKAKVMFSPFGDMELKAYAAAQPFGSRIGPVLDEADFVRMDVKPGIPAAPGSHNDMNFVNKIPNLPIREQGDTAATGNGWDTQEAISAFYEKFRSPDGRSLPSINQETLEQAYQAAMMPNPYEANRYNIINDLGDDPFVRNFDALQVAAFWAPVFPPSKESEANSRLQALVEDLIGDVGPSSADFKRALKQELTHYLDKLRKGQGERIGGMAEGFRIARIQDPFNTYSANGTPQPLSLSGGLSETRPEKLRSSWNGVLNGAFRKSGRVGYSVKFVSFDSLTHHRLKTDDEQVWTNDLDADAETTLDLDSIRH